MARTAGASPRATRKAEEEDRLERTKVDLQEKARSGAQDVSVTLNSLTPIKAYLLAFNTLSTILWSYVLLLTLLHIFSPHSIVSTSSSTGSILTRLFSTTKATFFRRSTLDQVWERLRGGYGDRDLGRWVMLTQNLALLEVVNAAMGWVRSGTGITAAQVASRLFAVHVVVGRYPESGDNPLYTTMILAWSITEVIRYSFYAFQLLGISVPGHNWLRYTLFIVLYPLGASSEAFLNLSTLPPLSNLPFVPSALSALSPLKTILTHLPSSAGKALMRSSLGRTILWNMARAGVKGKEVSGRSWHVVDYVQLVLFILWWPGLLMLMSHMFRQRRKVLGSGRKVGNHRKTN